MTAAPLPLVACDLDRTLIFSGKALALAAPEHQAKSLNVVEMYEGAPQSYMTVASERLITAIKASSTFVPATTRTVAQYSRVQLPGPPSEFAITTNGGVILHRGKTDAHWHGHMAARVKRESKPLAEVEAFLGRADFAPWVLRLRRAEDLFVYAIIDRLAMPEEFVAELEAFCTAAGWTVSIQGRKLYCIPVPINKATALAEVRRRTNADYVIAAGDSLLDQDMLHGATAAFRPRHGELNVTDYRAPHLRITKHAGALAGEEILAGINALLDSKHSGAVVEPQK
ncbi:HAD family hydrolase [Arthrobacter sp. 35W]|uniref:HAD family hydrolase n=1 Tax=Arthrobacter sp. 35W TaxID=1132441 RepID=UPI00040BE406|nr:HAD family hydrolase [Arthrobacter sp. 35W]